MTDYDVLQELIIALDAITNSGSGNWTEGEESLFNLDESIQSELSAEIHAINQKLRALIERFATLIEVKPSRVTIADALKARTYRL